jgi:hypothetical protein
MALNKYKIVQTTLLVDGRNQREVDEYLDASMV